MPDDDTGCGGADRGTFGDDRDVKATRLDTAGRAHHFLGIV
jgi:hypothetical protein